jgi:hypothetical protein
MRVITGLFVMVATLTLDAPSVVRAEDLRPEWAVERTRAGRPRVVGYLYNDNGLKNAKNVRLRVEQLTAAGAVDKVYQSWIFGDVLARTRSPFDVAVTEADGASTYRVLVESADWFMECR